jgi:S1-C subfamily serine protease
MKVKLYVMLALQMTLVGYMVYFYATFPDKIEQNITVRQEYRPTKISPHFLYTSVRIKTNTGLGSGVIISPKRILTAAHVVDDVGKGGTIWVSWQDEKGSYSNVASVTAIDAARDLALLTISGNVSFAHIASIYDGKLEWGDPVLTVGGPTGRYPVPSPGTFVHSGESNGMDMIKGEIAPGNSGGAVFDANTGQIIGIASRLCSTSQTNGVPIIALHVFLVAPSKWILDFLSENGAS